eukprot:jgi/Mesvir1/9692/Mv12170-RA.1
MVPGSGSGICRSLRGMPLNSVAPVLGFVRHVSYTAPDIGHMYPSHRAAVAVVSGIGALVQPRRADFVAAVGETTGRLAFARIQQRMSSDPEGRIILAERPRITMESLSSAGVFDMPANTFGGAYARFMGKRGFSADERPPVRYIDDVDLATDMMGEVTLKWIELCQTGLPMCALAVVGGPLRMPSERRRVLREVYLPWATQAAFSCADLMCLYYEKHFEDDIDELRKRWRIPKAPPMPLSSPGTR